jgi:hypothetical protein
MRGNRAIQGPAMLVLAMLTGCVTTPAQAAGDAGANAVACA